MAGRRLAMVERVAIEVGIARGDTDEELAVRLGRHRTTIWREVDRLVHHADASPSRETPTDSKTAT